MKPSDNEELSFRKVARSDAQLLFENAFSIASVTEYLQWDCHSSIVETEGLLSEMVSLHESGEKYFWIVASKRLGEPIPCSCSQSPIA